MNKIAWAVIACNCWAQTEPTPRQASDRLLEDLRGGSIGRTCTPEKGQPQAVCITDRDGMPPPARAQKKPTGETISVTQLQHKVPKEAAKNFERAIKLSRGGEHQKAAAELETALRRDPEFGSAENQIGVEYSYLGRWDEAENAFRRCTDIEPGSWMGHYNLGLTLYGRGDLPGAEQSTRRALALSSENPRIHLLLGELLVLREQTRVEGLDELKFAARTLSDARWVLRVLGTR